MARIFRETGKTDEYGNKTWIEEDPEDKSWGCILLIIFIFILYQCSH